MNAADAEEQARELIAELLGTVKMLAPYAQQRAEVEPEFTAKFARADYARALDAIAKGERNRF